MGMLQRMELVMENDEVLVIPGHLVRILEIDQVWDWNDPLPNGEDNIVTTFEQAQICLDRAAAVPYTTACGISSMDQLERLARVRDITWIGLFFEGEPPQSFFVPYEDDLPTPTGVPNRLMTAARDEEGNLWIWIDGGGDPAGRR